ncbi:S8 family serine peptidase [Streptacidiphilus sp. EB129]|uniref:S8 family serine peptidase n=1 Tax=Streptacidiphilus sp. EB129 TaxID=3156262 RepID=UPI003513E249
MGVRRTVSALGGAVLAGTLLLGSATTAAADVTRDAQWPLTSYGVAKDVWPHSTGKGVTVAVIDSGVRATHVDLTGQVLPGTDLVHGGNGQTDYADDGHGTGIASLIAGHGHGPGGGSGVMGIAPGVKILPIGVDPGHGDTGTVVAAAIRYAVDHGASVINMSFGSATAEDDNTEAAVAYAEAHNVVLVAASGNSAGQEDDYPASYPGVVSVGAVDQNGRLWSGSTSSSHLTVVAPGVGIVRDGGSDDTKMYQSDGTSFSAAFVSGIVALIRSAYPQLTQGQIVNYLIKAASEPTGITAPDPHWGYGIARPAGFALWARTAPGPAAGPLPQATVAATPGAGASDGATHPATGFSAGSGAGGSGGSGLLLGVGGGLAAVVLLVVLAVVLRRRRPAPQSAPPLPPYAQQQPPYQSQQGQQPYRPQSEQPYGQQPQQPSVYQNNPYAQPQPPQQQPPYGG